MKYILMALVLSGCAGKAGHETDTGSLRCIGYCELDIDRSESVIESKPDGSYYELAGSKGLGATQKKKEEKE
jgi:hypothetical protein